MEHIIQTVSQEGGIGNILMGGGLSGGISGVFGSFLGGMGGFPDAPYPQINFCNFSKNIPSLFQV